MKKNTGAQLALYPSPVVVVGAMVDGRPNWTLVAHATGCGTPSMTGRSRFPDAAYELGRRLTER